MCILGTNIPQAIKTDQSSFPGGRTLMAGSTLKPRVCLSARGRANYHPCFRDEAQREKGPRPGPPSWKILSMHLDLSGLLSGTKTAPAKPNSLQLEGERAV